MNARLSDRALLAFMLSASIASTIGGLPFNSLPVMPGSMADSFRLDRKAVGLMGSFWAARRRSSSPGSANVADIDFPTGSWSW